MRCVLIHSVLCGLLSGLFERYLVAGEPEPSLLRYLHLPHGRYLVILLIVCSVNLVEEYAAIFLGDESSGDPGL